MGYFDSHRDETSVDSVEKVDFFTDRRFARTEEPVAMHVERLIVQLEIDLGG